MANQTPEAIAQWAEKQAAPRNSPAYRRLTTTDLALILKYAKDGVSQVEIAKRLGVTQPAISQWLSKVEDSTDLAGLYLRGSALRMAKNVVNKGQARDHIAALKGIGVLENDSTDIKIAIGLSLPGLPKESYTETAAVSVSPVVDAAKD